MAVAFIVVGPFGIVAVVVAMLLMFVLIVGEALAPVAVADAVAVVFFLLNIRLALLFHIQSTFFRNNGIICHPSARSGK